MFVHSVIQIDDITRVAQFRRLAMSAARAEGLDETLTGNAAIIASEAASNVLKHATRGEGQIARLSDQGVPGVEIVAIDRGPGIPDFTASLRDGCSTTGTAGNGLGAMVRLSNEFDLHSEPGKGTVLVARVYASGRPSDAKGAGGPPEMSVGALLKPMAGEEVSGDNWAILRQGECGILLMADGLGHGVLAAEASAEAVAAFRRNGEGSPTDVLQAVHGALRSTRGAAVAVASIDYNRGVVRFAGIGNISGIIATPDKLQYMVSHNGTAGHEARRFQEFTYSLPAHAVVIMHSDGLTTNWNLEAHPGLIVRHPTVIAGVLYRDATRNRDDVCVVAAKRSARE